MNEDDEVCVTQSVRTQSEECEVTEVKRLTLSEEQQSQNTFLRERFLRMLTSISDHSVEFTLTNGSQLSASFVASDVDVLHFQVSTLQTPIGVQPHAILRATDCASFTVTLLNTD